MTFLELPLFFFAQVERMLPREGTIPAHEGAIVQGVVVDDDVVLRLVAIGEIELAIDEFPIDDSLNHGTWAIAVVVALEAGALVRVGIFGADGEEADGGPAGVARRDVRAVRQIMGAEWAFPRSDDIGRQLVILVARRPSTAQRRRAQNSIQNFFHLLHLGLEGSRFVQTDIFKCYSIKDISINQEFENLKNFNSLTIRIIEN